MIQSILFIVIISLLIWIQISRRQETYQPRCQMDYSRGKADVSESDMTRVENSKRVFNSITNRSNML